MSSFLESYYETLKLTQPFTDSKEVTLKAAGSLNFMIYHTQHGKVPSKLIFGVVSNTAYLDGFSKNPINCKHINLNYLEVAVDGKLVPNRPLMPNVR